MAFAFTLYAHGSNNRLCPFLNIFGKTSKNILLQFSTPSELEKLSVDTLVDLLASLLRKKISYEKAEILSDKAVHSFDVTFCQESFVFQLKLLITQIQFIEQQVNDTENEINAYMQKINLPITSIFGIDLITGTFILCEIGDISKFNNPDKLVAYAGIDASVSQSREYGSTHNRMSKRNSPYL